MARHIGRIKESNEQVFVSYMLLPEQDSHALVTFPDKLPDQLRKETSDALSSYEGQKSDDLGDVLGRRTFSNSGKSILQVLHETNNLIRTSIDDIVMTPDGNNKIPLRTVLEAIQKIPAPSQEEKFNPHTYNNVVEAEDERLGIANNLLIEADFLEKDAHNKREQAYKMAPSLRPAQDIIEKVNDVTIDATVNSETENLVTTNNINESAPDNNV